MYGGVRSSYAIVPKNQTPLKKGSALKQLTTLISTALTLFSFATQCGECIIRPATGDYLNAISALSHQAYQNHFMPLYSKITNLKQNIDDFVN